ncbi:hypothetical protein [Massilia sp. CCM 8734]|uniref:hypothetical protein n=1 Tax=Massilia sp. CCM 8734 TaxID=2609283 RepID=UPI0014235776|nr:hypothetical protein [Massilia sp. CCM 8734]
MSAGAFPDACQLADAGGVSARFEAGCSWPGRGRHMHIGSGAAPVGRAPESGARASESGGSGIIPAALGLPARRAYVRASAAPVLPGRGPQPVRSVLAGPSPRVSMARIRTYPLTEKHCAFLGVSAFLPEQMKGGSINMKE